FLVLAPSAARAQESASAAPIIVASKPFGESYLLAEMFAQLLESRGLAVERRSALGSDRCLPRVHWHRAARGAARFAHRFARGQSAPALRARAARIRPPLRHALAPTARIPERLRDRRAPRDGRPLSPAYDERSRARGRASHRWIHGGLHRASGRTRGARARVRAASARGAAARACGEVP